MMLNIDNGNKKHPKWPWAWLSLMVRWRYDDNKVDDGGGGGDIDDENRGGSNNKKYSFI